MGIARSTNYDAPAARAGVAGLLAAIMAICDEFEFYGWRRVQAALRHQGVVANHKRIKRLMREHDLQPRRRRRDIATTDSDHDQPIFPYRTKELVLDGPDQLWVADLTYVPIAWRLRLRRDHPRCLVSPRRRLRHRPVDRGAARRGGVEGGDRATAAIARSYPSLGLRIAIGVWDLPSAARLALHRWLDEPARQPIRQRQGRELHEDAKGGGGLPYGVRDVRRRRRAASPLHRPRLQPASPTLCAQLSQPGAVRRATFPAHGQIRRLNLSAARGPLQLVGEIDNTLPVLVAPDLAFAVAFAAYLILTSLAVRRR